MAVRQRPVIDDWIEEGVMRSSNPCSVPGCPGGGDGASPSPDNVFVLPLAPGCEADAFDVAPAGPAEVGGQTSAVRSAEIFLRVAYATQMGLHGMADNKSRMLIQLNGVVLSVLFAHQSPLLPSMALEPPAMMTLLCASVLSMALALLAARPPRTRARDAELGIPNVIGRSRLAIGPEGGGSAVERFARLIQDADAIDRGLLGGLHRLAGMLEAKHRLLRLAYLVFGAGMAITAALFGSSLGPIEGP